MAGGEGAIVGDQERIYGAFVMIHHKFHAVRTEVDGISFPSKKQAHYWADLQLAKKSGQLLFALREAPFHLPGGVRYVVDFIEFWADGTVKFTDVKGMKTTVYIAKKKMVEALYPVTINEA
jgi:Protein of unknown function (DUF1064).